MKKEYYNREYLDKICKLVDKILNEYDHVLPTTKRCEYEITTIRDDKKIHLPEWCSKKREYVSFKLDGYNLTQLWTIKHDRLHIGILQTFFGATENLTNVMTGHVEIHDKWGICRCKRHVPYGKPYDTYLSQRYKHLAYKVMTTSSGYNSDKEFFDKIDL